MDIKFYMQRIDIEGQPVKDLETDFEGLKYSKCEGINNIGKPRVYTEEYADSNKLRVYIPEDVTNDATTVNLKLYFIGDNMQNTFDAFNEYITGGTYVFWDTKRMKKITFILADEIKPSEEQWINDTRYMEVTYKLQCIYGKAEKI